MRRVFIVHWKPAEAGPLREAVRRAGLVPEEGAAPEGGAVTTAIRENPPDVVAIDLSRLPSHGREVGVWLRGRRASRHIPLVFVGGAPEKVAVVRAMLPDAVFADVASLGDALRALPARLAGGIAEGMAAPVTPMPVMQRYGNRTAAQKLGILEGGTVTVVDAPRDYLRVLGELPEGVDLMETGSEDAAIGGDVTLWFVREAGEFIAAAPRLRALAGGTKLWVLWRKGTGAGTAVRESALAAGLVDYKICSVDGRWSGIALARARL